MSELDTCCTTQCDDAITAHLHCVEDKCQGVTRYYLAKCDTDVTTSNPQTEPGEWVQVVDYETLNASYSLVQDVDSGILSGDGYALGFPVRVGIRYFTSTEDNNTQMPLTITEENPDGIVGTNWQEASLLEVVTLYIQTRV